MTWTANIDWLDGETITELKLDQLTQNVTYVKDYSVPSGGIIMWAGTVAQIPSGWYLCNGNNGTPNLVDRFIIGAGASYTPPTWDNVNKVVTAAGQMGGSNTHGHDLRAHVHVVNAVNTDHTHYYDHIHYDDHVHSGGTNSAPGTEVMDDSHASGDHNEVADTHSHSFTTNSKNSQGYGAYTYSLNQTYGYAVQTSTSVQGAGISHGHGNTGGPSNNATSTGDNVPVFYALCFIMKG